MLAHHITDDPYLASAPVTRSRYLAVLLCCLALLGSLLPARALVDEYFSQLTAKVQKDPPAITLRWTFDKQMTGKITVRIARKGLDDPQWGEEITIPGESPTSYTDTAVQVGQRYEYRVSQCWTRVDERGRTYPQRTDLFLCSGIEAAVEDNHGKLILLVDETIAAELAPELRRLAQDLAGDGWTVLRHDVPRHDEQQAKTQLPSIKALIRKEYAADPEHVKAVFLFGHVPIPYSGDTAPDGHEQHAGAWPADAYYGDLDGEWTDKVNWNFGHGRKNSAGDGYFDQMALPAPMKLQVGRVDLFDMPAFAPRTEIDLLRDYLAKDHAFRMKRLPYQRAGAAIGFYPKSLDDPWHLPALCEVAAGANFPDGSFLWHYPPATPFLWVTMNGLGGPSHQVAPWVDGPVILPRYCIGEFTLFSGSYYGQWDYQNDFLRMVLAAPHDGLTSMWGVYPRWHLHRMAMGETIGDTVRASMNVEPYETLVENDITRGWPLIGLMGDPALRQEYVTPPIAVSAKSSGGTVQVRWSASPEAMRGYGVYRGATVNGPFTRLTPEPVVGTAFADTHPVSGEPVYMVRAIGLTITPSGSYLNPSQGAFAMRDTVAPVAMASRATVAEDASTPVVLASTVGNSFIPNYAIVQPPAHGTLTGKAPNLTYTPTRHCSGEDRFTFEVSDGVAVSTPAMVNITVRHINHAPVATDQPAEVTTGTPSIITLRAGDIDLQDRLAVHMLTPPAHGTVAFSTLSARYTPAAGYLGADRFTYRVSDGQLTSDPATVSITIASPVIPMAGLQLWLRADALGLRDGAPVHTWEDCSGQGHTAYAATADPAAPTKFTFIPPVLKAHATPSGKPAVVFSTDGNPYGMGTKLAIPTINVGKRCTLLLVCNTSKWPNFRQCLLGTLDNAKAHYYSLFINETRPQFTAPGIGWQPDDSAREISGKYQRVAVLCADSNTTLFLDNAPVKTYPALLAGLGALALGWKIDWPQLEGLKGEIAEVLVYNCALTATEQSQVDAYLKAKYGLE